MSFRLRSTTENAPAERTQPAKQRLLIIGIAMLFVFATMQVAQAQKKKETELRVDGGDVGSLDGKLQGFERQLSGPEMEAIGLLLWRAATAPLDDPAGTNIAGSFFDLGSPTETVAGGGIMVATNPMAGQRKKIGGAGPQPPAADSEFVKILYAALGAGDAAAIGPKHDDPKPPPPGTINALADKLRGFGNQLSPKERGIMNWLLQRAGSNEAREAARDTGPMPGTPGGQPPTLGQALGLAAFGSRPGASYPNGWLLRF